MKIFTKTLAVCAAILASAAVSAQTPMLIHSHNDYDRNVPFYQAYAQGVASVEADVYYNDGKMLVAHNWEDVKEYKSLESCYLNPIATQYRQNGGRIYKDASKSLQLLVDIKEDTEPSLSRIIEIIEDKYLDVFGSKGVTLVITGNRPEPQDFEKYPEWVMFDGKIDIDYTPRQLERIALISECFRDYSHWNGKGSLLIEQEEAVRKVIAKAHAMGKTIRFWGGPESTTAYYTFYNFGIDWFNTDKPELCAEFFSRWGDKNFQIGVANMGGEGVSGTSKLDKVTRNFSGFQHSKLQLSAPIETYTPTYRNDGAPKKIKNVIYMIGDGMGMNQVEAGYYANRGLTVMNIKNLGFITNHAKDQFTTDSAAGGSALATGKKHSNRHIAADDEGNPYPSLTDYFSDLGKTTGVLTLGHMVDATPTAFYGHNVERDESDDLTVDLLESNVDILCGCGMGDFVRRHDGRTNLLGELKDAGFSIIEDYAQIDEQDGKVICIDNRMDDSANEQNLSLLADATRETISQLQKMDKKNKGFFLMVEGAKIDYAGHSMCLPGSILEMLSFDLAIKEALKFADQNGETLVIITADHETGGLVILDGDESTGRVMGLYFGNDHTPTMLPVFAYGPHSNDFQGIYKNTDIADKVRNLIKK
ncbi:MAG: alkaline phosphatase [Bacteroidales bacterium]|nr:alkaline phosphatase [Candidatus Cryptobacteroides choladohippi]